MKTCKLLMFCYFIVEGSIPVSDFSDVEELTSGLSISAKQMLQCCPLSTEVREQIQVHMLDK